ncbi:hypothetical protein HDU87_000446 [Geranomyces variabilis]|uniref:D-serine dehydratase-like domain-containing protein n=1 Tax=Geranomyces variabilis TaxID=109894 RepID=A0AAD5TNK5_9FUNG|nr:hypothetical protein HDU87_000446 [Geranomyces variabilis]
MRPSYAKDALLQQYAGLPVDALRSPALLVDRKKVKHNCRELLDAVQRAGLEARVHVKTHKTIEAALMQLGLDDDDKDKDKDNKDTVISAIMVSTLAEARAFAASGRFNDILYAVPLSPDKIQEIHQLSQLVNKFHVFVDNDEIIDALERYAMAVGSAGTAAVNPSSAVSQGLAGPPTEEPMFKAFLKIDTGYGRAGVPASNASAIKLATRLHNSAHISFSGLYSHSGHSYSAPDIDAALSIVKHEVRETLALAQLLRSLGVTAPHASVGATPSVKALLQVAGAAREAVMEARLATARANETLVTTADLAAEVARFALDDDDEDNNTKPSAAPPPQETPSATTTSSLAAQVNDAILHPVPGAPSAPRDFRLEVHLGNYVFLDVQQHAGMPWPLERCAATVLSRVLSVYPEREEVLIDAGALALSKDGPGPRGAETFPGYGAVLFGNDSNKDNNDDTGTITTTTTTSNNNNNNNNNASSQRRPHLTVTRVSQEHGVISTRAAAEEHNWRIGQTLRIVPNHACLAAANFEWYYVIEDGEVVDVWVPCRGW